MLVLRKNVVVKRLKQIITRVKVAKAQHCVEAAHRQLSEKISAQCQHLQAEEIEKSIVGYRLDLIISQIENFQPCQTNKVEPFDDFQLRCDNEEATETWKHQANAAGKMTRLCELIREHHDVAVGHACVVLTKHRDDLDTRLRNAKIKAFARVEPLKVCCR